MGTLTFLATVILAGITYWYARSTAQMLTEMKRQADIVRNQTIILVKAAQVSAFAALTNAAGHPEGENPFMKLRTLVKELDTFIDTETKSTPTSR